MCAQGCPYQKAKIESQNMMMLDKYGLKWEMLLPRKVKYLTYLGIPIVKLDKQTRTSFDFLYKRPSPISLPSPMAPPLSILRPTMSGPRVSFIEPRILVTLMGGYRPKGSLAASSGHPTTKVPVGSLPIASLHTPLITSRFRPGGSMGVPTRHKTIPL